MRENARFFETDFLSYLSGNPIGSRLRGPSVEALTNGLRSYQFYLPLLQLPDAFAVSSVAAVDGGVAVHDADVDVSHREEEGGEVDGTSPRRGGGGACLIIRLLAYNTLLLVLLLSVPPRERAVRRGEDAVVLLAEGERVITGCADPILFGSLPRKSCRKGGRCGLGAIKFT